MKKRILSIVCAAALILSTSSCAEDSPSQGVASQQTSQSSDDAVQQTTSAAEQTAVTTTTNTSAVTEQSTPKPESTSTATTTTTAEQISSQPEMDVPVSTTAATTATSTVTSTATSTVTSTVTSASTTASAATTTTAVTTTSASTTSKTSAATSATSTSVTTTATTATVCTSAPIEQENPVEADFFAVYEAEDASLHGSLRTGYDSTASGGAVVEQFESDSDYLSFTIDVPVSALYDITFVSSGIGSYKENYAYIDGSQIGMFTSENGVYTDYTIPSVSISEGRHELKILKSWGWMKLDCIKLQSSKGIDDDVYNVSDRLINKNADKRTKELFSYLSDCYGEYILSGQVCDGGINGAEFSAIHDVTGKYPAILGLDMMDYTPSRANLGTRSDAVERAIEFSEMGGIVTFCWHWNAPTYSLKSGNDSNGHPRWWGGFYTDNTNFNFEAALDGRDSEGMKAIDNDIKEIALQLKRLEEEGVPVIWRPLHEASGGWFWWGAQGAEAYKKLWIYLYEQLTYKYECNNLIWVFNGQASDWYPGDKYVDIIGEDIYPGNRVYSPQSAKFTQAVEYSDTNKIVALTENGCVFDIDIAVQANVMWGWFNTWGGEFTVSGGKYSENFTEKEIIQKAYDSKYVLTLDELDW